MHEASLNDANSFITLTYADEFLPSNGSLSKPDLQKFLKRLRHGVGVPIRYYAVGEYGSHFGRPHYHCLIFGFDFPDKKHWTNRANYKVCRSGLLEKKWKYGQSEVGSFTKESAGYCTRYMVKNYSEDETAERVRLGLTREFALFSKSLGKEWCEANKRNLERDDSLILDGHQTSLPNYYDSLLDENVICRLKRRRSTIMKKKDMKRGPSHVSERLYQEAKINLNKEGGL